MMSEVSRRNLDRIKGTIYEPEDAKVTLERYMRSLGNTNLYSAQKNKVINRLLQKERFSGKNVLDIGCGGGLWTGYFLSHGAIVTSCDVQKHIIEAAEMYLNTKGFDTSRVKLICCDIMDFESKEVFDFIFAKDVLVHIYEDEKFLAKLYKMLPPRGKCYLSAQNAFCLNYLVEAPIQRLRGNKHWKGGDPTHVRFYTPFSLKKKLQKAGFKITNCFGVYHIPYKVLISIVTRIFTGKSRSFEHPVFHFLEKWGEDFPFNITGWYIGVIVEKQ